MHYHLLFSSCLSVCVVLFQIFSLYSCTVSTISTVSKNSLKLSSKVPLACISRQTSTSLDQRYHFLGVQTSFGGELRWVRLRDSCCQKPFVEWGRPLRYLLNNRIGCILIGPLNIHQVYPINTYFSVISYTTAITIMPNSQNCIVRP